MDGDGGGALTPQAIELQIVDPRIEMWGVPKYESEAAAAVDLRACIPEALPIAPGDAAMLVSAGIAIHINNPNIAAIITPRSSVGHKRGLVLGNISGLIDADYTGTIFISCWNRNVAGSPAIVIEPGERIAQMRFVPVIRPQFDVVKAFSSQTTRGAGGLGSTGMR